MSNDTVLKMVGIDKRFGGIHALDHVDFDVRRGEVMVLMGENGAGKSTLMKILAGIYSKDSGEIHLDGEQVEIANPVEARNQGIAMIHQELSMCTNMSIAENIFRNEEPTYGFLRMVDARKMLNDAQAILDGMDMNLQAHLQVDSLSIAQQQMVEIARAVSKNARIVVMDEPTSSLTEKEVEALFEIISGLKEQNVGVIYISHRM
ncbi:MAG: ATP-binding cassette domain-containing protein, partial [Christensenellales bacterium]